MTLKKKIKLSLLLSVFCVLFMQFIVPETTKKESGDVLGYGILSRLPGLWNGPITSVTPAGNFPAWYVDFRPVSAGQVSQFSMIDSQTVNGMSFFIVKHDNQLKVAMRTDACFNKECCVTYEAMDSVNEKAGFYRFSDFQRGTDRAYTEFTFKDDELLMEVFTNKFNKGKPGQFHVRWEAKLGDRTAAAEAIARFSYPQAHMIKDFSDVFNKMPESIFFSMENDPYNSASQPYMGSATINISIIEDLKVKKSDELFILLTTESLFEGLKYIEENKKYFSKYLFLPGGTKSYTIKNVHPGKYYVYSFLDVNKDRKHLKGDYMSSDLYNIITVPGDGNATVTTVIDLLIP